MEVITLEKDKNYEKVKLIFSKEDVEKAEERLARRLNREVELPGFRKGKVPKSVLKMRFPEFFERELVDELVNAWLGDRVDSLLLEPRKIGEERKDDGVMVELELHWKPEVELPDPSELTVRVPNKETITRKFIEISLDDLRKEHAILEPKEGEAEEDDVVRLKYDIVDGETGEVVKEDESAEIGVDDVKWLKRELMGKKKGEKITASVVEEAEDSRYKLQGVIEQVYKRILPELNDDFAASVDEKYKTLDELKADLQKKGEEAYEDFKADSLPRLAFDKLIESSELVISTKTLDFLAEGFMEKLRKDGEYEKAVEEAGSEEKLREALKQEAVESLKRRFVPIAYGKKYDISVSDDEVEEYVEKMAPLWSTTPEDAKKAVFANRDLFWSVVRELYERKVADHLLQKVKVEETEETEEAEEEK